MTLAPSAKAITPGERDPYYDNVRAILIILVVVGHLLRLVGATSAEPLSLWIYSFHMPAFVLISGYLSRKFTARPDQMSRLLTGILVPYVIFQLLHGAARTLLFDGTFRFSIVIPAWTLWFLLALFIWRLLTPLFRAVRFPVLLAVLVSVLAPLDSQLDQTWSMARVLGMLPFYVLGLSVKPSQLDFLRTRVPRWIAFAALLVGLLGAYVFVPDLRASLFHLSGSYSDAGSDMLRGMLIRVLVLGVGVVGTALVLAATGPRRTWLTRVGRYSLYVYLLHALVLFPVRYTDFLGNWTSPTQTVVLVVVGTLLAVALASPPVVAVTRWVIEPPFAQWLIRRPAPK